MICTHTTVRRDLDGVLMGAVVEHVDGRQHFIGPDIVDLHEAISRAIVELEASHASMPAPTVDVLRWLAGLATDRRIKRTSMRVAVLIAASAPGRWQGLASLGERLVADPANVAKAIDRLVALGYVFRTHHQSRAYYSATMPGRAL